VKQRAGRDEFAVAASDALDAHTKPEIAWLHQPLGGIALASWRPSIHPKWRSDLWSPRVRSYSPADRSVALEEASVCRSFEIPGIFSKSALKFG
jgi:hypothetical protein